MEKAKVTELLSNGNGANATGNAVETPPWRDCGRAQVIATIVGTGAIVSTITVAGSLDGVNFVDIGTISLTANASDTDKLAIDYVWPFLRATSSAAAGTVTSLRVALVQ